MNFFSFNFALREYLFCTSPAPPPHKFSNGPFLSMRATHDEGIKKMCSTGRSSVRSKLVQSCSNATLKPKLKPTVQLV